MGIFFKKEQAAGFTKQSDDLHSISMKQTASVWKWWVKAYFMYLNYIYLPFSWSSVKIRPFLSRKKDLQRLDAAEFHFRVPPEQRWSPLNPQLTHCLFKPIGHEPQVIRGHLSLNFCYSPQQKLGFATLTGIFRGFLCCPLAEQYKLHTPMKTIHAGSAWGWHRHSSGFMHRFKPELEAAEEMRHEGGGNTGRNCCCTSWSSGTTLHPSTSKKIRLILKYSIRKSSQKCWSKWGLTDFNLLIN